MYNLDFQDQEHGEIERKIRGNCFRRFDELAICSSTAISKRSLRVVSDVRVLGETYIKVWQYVWRVSFGSVVSLMAKSV